MSAWTKTGLVLMLVQVGLVQLPGCAKSPSATDQSARSSTPQPKQTSVTEGWLGRWNGPEGSYLLLSGGNGKYEVTIANLDGPRKFVGVAADEQIEFERDGVKESLRATNGDDTGMKWLAGKSRCLTVRKGEGYCQD